MRMMRRGEISCGSSDSCWPLRSRNGRNSRVMTAGIADPNDRGGLRHQAKRKLPVAKLRTSMTPFELMHRRLQLPGTMGKAGMMPMTPSNPIAAMLDPAPSVRLQPSARDPTT